VLINPYTARRREHRRSRSAVSEETTVYFYHSVNTNCLTATTQPLYDPNTGTEPSSSFYTAWCASSTQSGNPINQQTSATPIYLWANNQGTLVYNYSAYLTTSCTDGNGTHYGQNFYVTVQDPHNGAYVYQSCIPVQGFFANDATNMLNQSEPGYVTMGIQKSLAIDIFHNPLADIQSTIMDWAAVGINQLQIANQ